MKIKVTLFSTLKKYHPTSSGSNSFVLNMAPPCLVDGVIKQLGIPPKDVKMIFINGKKIVLNQNEKVNDGDEISFLPSIAGG